MPKGSHAATAKEIGATSEALVLARLVELGYAVSIPFGGHLRYDLVVDDGSELTRVQVKTGRLTGNRIVFPTASRGRRSYVGAADDFLVYCPETSEIYRIPVEACGHGGSSYLYLSKPLRKTTRPELYWAKDHVFTGAARLAKIAPLATCAATHPDTPSRMAEKTDGRPYCKECNLVWGRLWRARKAAEATEVSSTA
jgi:PD-(D/E)XK endonuclease